VQVHKSPSNKPLDAAAEAAAGQRRPYNRPKVIGT
jgi:hypothetical protein